MMKKKTKQVMKKTMSIALAASLLISVAPANVYAEEVTYTPVQASDNIVAGFHNEQSDLDMNLFARYNSGAMSGDGGSMEIVSYNSKNGFAYTVSGIKGVIVGTEIDSVTRGNSVKELNGIEYNVKELTAIGDNYGDITSVSISPDGTKLAAAIQHADYDKNGWVALFTCQNDGTLTFDSLKNAGVQPDMVTFANDTTILSANEGEPRNGYTEPNVDPKGSVTIIDLTNSTSASVGFEQFTAEELTAKNILIGKVNDETLSPETDLEPEYIAVSHDGKTAYISLQEANAIAVLDIATKKYTGIYSCDFEDYGTDKVKIDINDDKTYAASNYDGLVGARMPDGISIYEKEGKTYLLTANEGDSREWGDDYANEKKVSGFGENKIRAIDSKMCDGLPSGKTVMFGGRSFTIFEMTKDGMTEVYDSGDDFEKITNQYLPDYFNCSNDDIKKDSRSQKKGPEPESIIVGTIKDRTYAFTALERIGGIMVYDITEPAKAEFSNYINSREFAADIQGDVSPEGLSFIKENKAGNAVLLAACEVSGTLAAYEIISKRVAESEDNKDNAQNNTQNNTTTPNTSAGTNNKPNDNNNTNTATVTKPDTSSVKKGNTYTIDGRKFKVTKANGKGKGTVTYVGTTKKNKQVTIPATIQIAGVNYQVTAIGNKTFYKNKTLKKITIGKNITSIGKNAFNGCKNLKSIIIKSTKIKKIGSNAFKGIHSKAKIKTPKKKWKSYKKLLKKSKLAKSIKVVK